MNKIVVFSYNKNATYLWLNGLEQVVSTWKISLKYNVELGERARFRRTQSIIYDMLQSI